MVGDLRRRTRESLTREYRLAKYYAGNGKYSDASGRKKALDGEDAVDFVRISEFSEMHLARQKAASPRPRFKH